MSRAVHVAGVGMVPFGKPGITAGYLALGGAAGKAALADAGVGYPFVDQVYAGYVEGGACSGQAVAYQLGLSGVPVFNVHNHCATGASALFLARQAVAGDAAECVLVLGFDQMRRGALAEQCQGQGSPEHAQRFLEAMEAVQGRQPGVPVAAQLFGGAGRMHMQLYGTRPDTFARIAVKARRHAAHNPLALLRAPLSLDEVLSAPPVFDPLTRLQCATPTCGAAAAVLCSRAFAVRHGLDRSVVVAAQAMGTDGNSSFDERDLRKLVGYEMTRRTARQVYEAAGLGPKDLDVVELHDCFTTNELISYEALGLAAEGEGEKMVLDGDNTYGGRIVANPSGGLLAKGHPLGATGLAQCAELVWQLRGQAGSRQVDGARLALQHNLGLGGACVVTLYARA